MSWQDAASTPGRRAHLEFDTPYTNNTRWEERIGRRQDQIAASADLQVGLSPEAEYLPGYGWRIRPRCATWHDAASVEGLAAFLTDADGSAKSDGTTLQLYYAERSPGELGVATSGSMADQWLPTFRKTRPAGQSYSAAMDDDWDAFPGPTSNDLVPMERVWVGNRNYRANTGYVFAFKVPRLGAAAGLLYRMYFGGPVGAEQLTGTATQAGEWCVELRGDGTAQLLARVDGTWTPAHQFRYSSSSRVAPGWHHLRIVPIERLGIWLRCFAGDGEHAVSGPAGPSRPSRRDGADWSVFRMSRSRLPFRFTDEVAGAGVVRVDARADLPVQFRVARELFPAECELVDGEAAFGQELAAGTEITLTQELRTAGGAVVVTVLEDAEGNTITADENGTYVLASPTRGIRLRWTLIPGDANETSPAVLGWQAQIRATQTRVVPTPLRGGRLLGVTWVGGERDPSGEHGRARIVDDLAALPDLALRDGIPCRLYTDYDVSDPSRRTILGEGRTCRVPTAPWITLPGGAHPDARSYEVSIVGMAQQLAEAELLYAETLVPEGQEGLSELAYPLLTDVLARAYRYAGFAPDQVEMPSSSLRWWPDEGNGITFRAGLRMLDLTQQLLGLLNWAAAWDGNANAGVGAWRHRPPPTLGDTNVLARFVTAPTQPGRLVHHPGAFAAGEFPIWSGTWQRHARRPVYNDIRVIGVSGQSAQGTAGKRLEQRLYNPRSYTRDPAYPTADPTSVDWRGQRRPLVYVNSFLRRQSAVDFMCRRLYDAVALGRHWHEWESPCALVVDPTDTLTLIPRPLRFGDLVEVDGARAMIVATRFSSLAELGGDLHQRTAYTAVELRDATLGVGFTVGALAGLGVASAAGQMQNARAAPAGRHYGLQQIEDPVFSDVGVGSARVDEILGWEIDRSEYQPLQDPTTGALYFVAGISDPLGPDLVI